LLTTEGRRVVGSHPAARLPLIYAFRGTIETTHKPGIADMPKQSERESYSDRETEERVQAALRGARLVGPKPRASTRSVRAAKKRRLKRGSSAST
jgi:hypothetical protein